jgi:hypothetical protein
VNFNALQGLELISSDLALSWFFFSIMVHLNLAFFMVHSKLLLISLFLVSLSRRERQATRQMHKLSHGAGGSTGGYHRSGETGSIFHRSEQEAEWRALPWQKITGFTSRDGSAWEPGPPLLPALAVGAFAPLSITGDEMAVVEVSTRRMGSRGWPNSRISTSACTVVCAYDFRLAMLLMTALLKTG